MNSCRFCSGELATTFADLGTMPLANSYVTPEDVAEGRDIAYPLVVRVCHDCLLVQADEVVAATDIFDADYAYFSSYSDTWVEHARRFADATTTRFGLGPDTLVVEVASNDGYLLQHFARRGIPVLGIEPTANTARAARAIGIDTRVEYFTSDGAQRLAAEGVQAEVLVANNVLAHVPDIRDFVAGFGTLLAPGGVASFEFQHVLRLIEHVQFDTIYHEHYAYLSLHTTRTVLASAGLRVFDVEELPTHGGSLRVLACHDDASFEPTPAVGRVLAMERDRELDTPAGYTGFDAAVHRARESFRTHLAEAAAAGRTVAAYGAAAKANTFFNLCGVGPDDVTMIGDRSHAKQGRLLPGSHVPIVSPETLIAARPDEVVIGAWNLADEIRTQLAELEAGGTRFVVGVPVTRILGQP